MLRALTRPKYRQLVLCAALLCAGAGLILYPGQSMQAGRDGLQLCFNVIIPSLFPFFVLSSLVVELGVARYLGRALERLMVPLFRVNGACACALVLGFVGGYPVGAQTAISLYQKGLCSRTEAQRLLAFCNNSGPAFILGVVGSGVFASGQIGLLLYLAHVAASVCVGLVFRFYRYADPPTLRRGSAAQIQAVRFSAAFTSSVKTSFSSIWNICAFVVFFTVVIRLLFQSGAMGLAAGLLGRLGIDPAAAEHLLMGLLELSSGVTALTGAGTLTGRVSLAAFMLGWAGLSVHCQVLSFLGDSGLSPGTYVAGKALHGGLSALFALALSRSFDLSQPVSSYLEDQVASVAGLDFGSALTASTAMAWLLWLCFVWVTVRALRQRRRIPEKSSRKAGKSAL